MGDVKTTLTWLLRDEVTGPAKKIEGALGGAAAKAEGAGGLMGKLGAVTGGLVTPFSIAAAAGTALVGGLLAAGKAAAEEQKNVAKMGAALKASVPNFDGNTDAIEKLITQRENLAFSDDDLRDSMAILVTSTHDVTQAQDLQATAMDLARLKGVDLATASEALAKANNGSTKELKALGITVDDTKDKTQVLAAIQKAAAGQAEAYAETTNGKWEKFQIKLQDVVEEVGGKLLPVFNDLADFAVNDLVPAILVAVDAIETIAGGISDVIQLAEHLLGIAGQSKGNRSGLKHKIIQNLAPHQAGGIPLASGGYVEHGTTYLVGEHGPELFVGPKGGGWIDNGSGSGSGSSGSPVVIALQLDGREIARTVDEHLYYALTRSAPTTLPA